VYFQLLPVAERMEEIADSLCVGQPYRGDERVVLFLKMAAGHRCCAHAIMNTQYVSSACFALYMFQ